MIFSVFPQKTELHTESSSVFLHFLVKISLGNEKNEKVLFRKKRSYFVQIAHKFEKRKKIKKTPPKK